MTVADLRAMLDPLPPDATVPVGWVIEQLEECAEARGSETLSLSEFAVAAGVSPSTIRRLDRGDKLPNVGTRARPKYRRRDLSLVTNRRGPKTAREWLRVVEGTGL